MRSGAHSLLIPPFGHERIHQNAPAVCRALQEIPGRFARFQPAVGSSQRLLLRFAHPDAANALRHRHHAIPVHGLEHGRSQHERHSGEQPLLVHLRADSRLRSLHRLALHRPVPHHRHTPEDELLFCLRGHHGAHAHRHCSRHPFARLPQNRFAAPLLLLRRAQGRHHRPHERRRQRG